MTLGVEDWLGTSSTSTGDSFMLRTGHIEASPSSERILSIFMYSPLQCLRAVSWDMDKLLEMECSSVNHGWLVASAALILSSGSFSNILSVKSFPSSLINDHPELLHRMLQALLFSRISRTVLPAKGRSPSSLVEQNYYMT